MAVSARISIATVAIAALVVPSAALAGQPVPPTDQPLGLIYVQGGHHGTLTPTKGSSFHLSLRRTAPQTLAFETSPARQSWQIPTRRFLGSWAGLGFNHDPPNAVLSLLHGDPNADTIAFRLTHPRKQNHGRRVTYRARQIDAATGNLANFDSQLDARVPHRFGAASLFIDDASGPVVPCNDANLCQDVDGCVIQPDTSCNGFDMRGADLEGADLHGSDLSNSVLSGANLHAADLRDTAMVYTDLTNADLSDSSLARADLAYANLRDADISGADQLDVTYCHTTMPWGAENNSGC